MKYKAICPPEWLSRSAIYQINPRTFCKEGTISAITKELPKLKDLGFSIMYLCPIFDSDDSEDRNFWSKRQIASNTDNPKNPYRMNNYFKIDSEYGTEDDLREFINEAHKLDMHVILDLVYLHIGPNASIIKRHPEFARQDKNGATVCSIYRFPYLDFSSAGLREYLWCNMIYYIAEIGADGFRCDVGDDIPLDFWVEARRRMHAVKPDSVLINEGRKWDYLISGFDSSYCISWEYRLYEVFSGKLTAAQLRECRETLDSELPAGAKIIMAVDTHDTVTDWPERTEILAGNDGMEQIEVINYLIDGIPMVYCGNELADSAKLSMFANRFHQGSFEFTDRIGISNKDYSLRRQNVMKRLNALKHDSDVLLNGDTVWIDNSEPEKIFSFAREYNGKKITFVGNFCNETVTVKLNENISGNTFLENGVTQISDNTLKLSPHGYITVTSEK